MTNKQKYLMKWRGILNTSIRQYCVFHTVLCTFKPALLNALAKDSQFLLEPNSPWRITSGCCDESFVDFTGLNIRCDNLTTL
jgi:hypothetical protein